MTQKTYQSQLGNLVTQKKDLDSIKHDGWHDDGVLVVNIDDERLSWADKELISLVAEKLYGIKQ